MRRLIERTFDGGTSPSAPQRVRESGDSAVAFESPVPAGAAFDVAMLQEDITRGQRVEAFRLDLCAGGECREFARGTTIGHKRLLRFPGVEVAPAQTGARVRLTIEQSRGIPVISRLSVHAMALE
jgi:alpha-L-fucosidase